MTRRLVKYIGGGSRPKRTDITWGGTTATNAAYLAAFKDDPEYKVVTRFREDFAEKDRLALALAFLDGADIVHVDDTSIVALMLNAGVVPDVIGPITRSPTKNYRGWTCPYADKADEFYSAKVIRLNYSEERKTHDLVTLIRHGVDTEALTPSDTPKRYVIWAGMAARPAKNHDLWVEIMRECVLPEPFEFKTMSRYNVEDYWTAVDEAAILVNTSHYESFCSAMAEARAKGVPVIYREGLHGPGVMEDGEIQVEYVAEAYQAAILDLLGDGRYFEAGARSRAYAETHMSLSVMRDDIAAVYDTIVSK